MTETEKPRRRPGSKCPLWRSDVSKVCHTCEWYTQIRGINPNTGGEIDHWGCAIAWQPLLTIENSQQQRQTGAAVENFRNEMVRAQDATTALVLTMRQATRQSLPREAHPLIPAPVDH